MTAATNMTITDGVRTLTVDLIKMEKILNNKLNQFTPPKSTARQTTDDADSQFGENTPKIVNLLRIDTIYTINGVISQGSVGSDSNSDVQLRKDDLEDLYRSGAILTFNYDNETGVTGLMQKLTITKIIDDGQNAYNTSEAGYTVMFTLFRGELI